MIINAGKSREVVRCSTCGKQGALEISLNKEKVGKGKDFKDLGSIVLEGSEVKVVVRHR